MSASCNNNNKKLIKTTTKNKLVCSQQTWIHLYLYLDWGGKYRGKDTRETKGAEEWTVLNQMQAILYEVQALIGNQWSCVGLGMVCAHQGIAWATKTDLYSSIPVVTFSWPNTSSSAALPPMATSISAFSWPTFLPYTSLSWMKDVWKQLTQPHSSQWEG